MVSIEVSAKRLAPQRLVRHRIRRRLNSPGTQRVAYSALICRRRPLTSWPDWILGNENGSALALSAGHNRSVDLLRLRSAIEQFSTKKIRPTR